MDSRLIDVAIGLALVFAIASLMATALQEIWTQLASGRGRYLHQAIVSFVGDQPDFANELLRHPLLVSLSRETKDEKRLPSYISSDVMVSALMGTLVKSVAGGIRPGAPRDLVAALQAATSKGNGSPNLQLPGSELTDALTTLAQGVEDDWVGYEKRVTAWYDAVCTRSAGWFKRKTSAGLVMFGFLIAAVFNINPLVIAPRLWDDGPLRNAMVKAGESASKVYDESTKGAGTTPASGTGVPSAGSPSNGPAGKVTQIRSPESARVERHLAELQAALFAGVESFKAHPSEGTWELASATLNHLYELRGALDRRREPDSGSISSLRLHSDANTQIRRALNAVRKALPPPADQRTDPHAAAGRTAAALDAAITAELEALASRTERRLRDCAPQTDPATREFCLRLNDLDSLQRSGLPIGWSPQNRSGPLPDGCDELDAKREPTVKTCQGWNPFQESNRAGNFIAMILGWFIMGLVCSLGAPFWFDLLGKLVKMRGSGNRPEDGAKPAAGDGTQAPATTLTRSAPETVPPATGEAMSDRMSDAEKALSQYEAERIQRALQMPNEQVTGVFDAVTRASINKWQASRGYDASSILTRFQIDQLLGNQDQTDGEGYVG